MDYNDYNGVWEVFGGGQAFLLVCKVGRLHRFSADGGRSV